MRKQKRYILPEQKSLPAADAALVAFRTAVEQKGLDVRALDIRNVTDIADYFVIVSGTSERHVQGIVDKVAARLKELGEEPISKSGYEQADWVLLDYGYLVVHVFYEPTRQYYAFDDLWKKGEPLELPEELVLQARKLRTGLIRERALSAH